MTRQFFLAAAICLAISACGGNTNLPDPTGKASVRALNAIPRSPAVEFLIEERTIGVIPYKGISATARYDDFSYNFNFDVRFAGESEDTRIATTAIDFEPDREYTLLLTGTVSNATAQFVETAEREFADTETVFQTRFLHTADSLPDFDIYLLEAGVLPTAGMPAASLTRGDIGPPVDIESGDYALFITPTGDPATILFESVVTTIPARSNLIIAPFDGDANDLEAIVVRGLATTGGSIAFSSVSVDASVEFLQAAIDLGSSDVYDDEALTSQVVADLEFMDLTPQMTVANGATTYRYTPAGDTSAVTLETTVALAPGVRYRIVSSGADGTYLGGSFAMDRAAIDTSAKLQFFQTSQNFDFLNIYALQDGAAVEDSFPIIGALARGSLVSAANLAAGQYELVATEFGSTDIIAGPVAVDVALGDVLDIVIFDTADPALLEMRWMNAP